MTSLETQESSEFSTQMELNSFKHEIEKSIEENEETKNVKKVTDFLEKILSLGESGKGPIKDGLDSLELSSSEKQQIMRKLQALSANSNIISNRNGNILVNKGNLMAYVKTFDEGQLKNFQKLAAKVEEMKK